MRNTDKRRDILDLKIGKSVKYTAAAFSGAFMHYNGEKGAFWQMQRKFF